MESVFLLWHVQNSPGSDDGDEKLIGVYRTKEHADAAVLRLKERPGFREAPEGFHVDEYELNKDHWTEGYLSTQRGTR